MFVHIVICLEKEIFGAYHIVKVFKHRLHAEECCRDLDPVWDKDPYGSDYRIVVEMVEENTIK